ncbi:MAG: hypothetical protein ACO1HP_07525 [Bacteroidota bacterium]
MALGRLEKLLRQRSAALASGPEKLLSAVGKAQRKIYEDLLLKIGQLERSGGRVVLSEANLALVRTINNELEGVLFGTDYVEAVSEFAASFKTTKEITDSAFKAAFPDFEGDQVADQVFRYSQRTAVEALTGATVETGFLEPLRGAISQAVSTGADWTETVDLLRAMTIGDADYDGKLAKYVKQVAWDALAVSDRTYAQAVAKELETEWWYYSGGELPTTREFCIERMGKYWHTEEIRSWASLEWKGKMDEVTTADTIFSYLGGWNCRHTLMPVSDLIVPMEDQIRAAEKGYWKIIEN